MKTWEHVGPRSGPRLWGCLSIMVLASCFSTVDGVSAEPPKMLWQRKAVHDAAAPSGTRTSFALMRLPDGSFAFYNRNDPFSGPLTLPDADGREHTLLPWLPESVRQSEAIAGSDVLANTQVILTPQQEIKSVYVQGESLDKETAARVGLPRYLDVWIKQASLTEVAPPQRIWRGYNGSQMEYQQFASGRIIVPFGSFQPHAKPVPPHGRHKTVIQYSDDGGRTWSESVSQLISPCYPGFNGNNEGACEPAIESLRDGRLWMLMRTQAGFLYESHSADDGTTWTAARASRFSTSTGPPNILRHRNGWLVVCWNNCEMPPREDGQGVYGGRDALHIAISQDDGQTWRGFREIYLDHRRNDNPARNGDRGTAYPLAAFTDDGKIVVLAGQGEGGRNPILVDPEWILETRAADDFSGGLENWSVYKHHGPARGWWRAREVGCDIVPDPTAPDNQCLHLRKPDELPADGAVWNVPNGWRGRFTARVMIRSGFHGGSISLNDRMFDPANPLGEKFAMFRVELPPDGKLGNASLTTDRWHEVTLQWDLSQAACEVLVDGEVAKTLQLANPTLNGISYVRLRSSATQIDTAGYLVDRVEVVVEDPVAPPRTAAELAAHEQRYVESVVPLWEAGE